MKKAPEQPKPENCPNCQFDLSDKMDFCPSCGQRILPEHLTFTYFLKEFLNNYFSFDSRFIKTLKPLLFKPAWLTLEFIGGKRVRYINPVQVFIFSSFLYFLVDSLVFVEKANEKDVLVFSADGKTISTDSLDQTQIDSLFISEEGESNSGWNWNHFLLKAYRFNQLDKATQNAQISKTLSYAIFFLTPLFAVYIGWLFKKRNRKYLENLLFSLHFHAFYFILATIFLVIGRVFPFEFLKLVSFLIVAVYLISALRTFFLFSWKSTIGRFGGLLVLYGFTVMVFFIGSIFFSVLLF